jgi:hypothetical protein
MYSTSSEAPSVSHNLVNPQAQEKILTTISCCRVTNYSTMGIWEEIEECRCEKRSTYTVYEGLKYSLEVSETIYTDFVLF